MCFVCYICMWLYVFAYMCFIFILYSWFAWYLWAYIKCLYVLCYPWVKGEFLQSLYLIHIYITLWVLSSSKRERLWAERPITLVLMMINLCRYIYRLSKNYWGQSLKRRPQVKRVGRFSPKFNLAPHQCEGGTYHQTWHSRYFFRCGRQSWSHFSLKRKPVQLRVSTLTRVFELARPASSARPALCYNW